MVVAPDHGLRRLAVALVVLGRVLDMTHMRHEGLRRLAVALVVVVVTSLKINEVAPGCWCWP